MCSIEDAHSVHKPAPEEPRVQPSSSLILAKPPLYYRFQGKAWAIDPQAEVESGMFFCQ
jgi:hypothetical protein